MVFTNSLRSKLISLLRPWLVDTDEQEPQFDLHLGFLVSEFKANKLDFDVSALNLALDESSPFVFEKFVAQEVELRVSPLSNPSFHVHVKNIDVTVAPRELERLIRRESWKDLAEKEKKQIIALIDPEGAILHETIEALSVKFSQNRLLTNLKSSILRSLNIKFDEININMHCPEEPYFLTLKAKDLLFEQNPNSCTSFFKGFLGSSLFSRRRNNCLNISCTSLDFQLTANGTIHQVVSFMDLSTFIRFENLRPSDFIIRISNIHLKISLETVSNILKLFDKFLNREEENINTRKGQELWFIASRKLNLRKSFYNVANMVITWQHYVCNYMLLLSIIGYSDEMVFTKNCIKMQLNGNCRVKRSVRLYLEKVNKLEENLPMEAIAQGRKIARIKISSNCRDNNNKSWGNFVKYPILKIFKLVSLIFGFILSIFQFFLRVLGLDSENSSSFMNIFRRISNDFDAQMQYSFYLGEFKFTFSTNETLNPKTPTICLVVNSTTFINSASSLKRITFVSLGEVKLFLEKEKRILWSDPVNSNILKDNFVKLLSNWNQINESYNETSVDTERPFVLFEFESTILDLGIQNFELLLGKLNANLEYEFISCIYQIYFMSSKLNGETQSLSNPNVSEEETQARLNEIFIFYTNKLKKLWLSFVPQNNTKISTIITGPQIRIKLGILSVPTVPVPVQELSIDLDMIEFSMWPKMERVQNPIIANANAREKKYICKRNFAFGGFLKFSKFGVFVEDLKENSVSRILGPMSTKLEFSTLRDSIETLYGSDNYLSTNLNGDIFGISCDLYMDELLSLFQGLRSMLYTISSTLFLSNPIYSPNFMRKSTNSRIKDLNRDNDNIQLVINSILKIDSIEIMLKNSRDSDIDKFGTGLSISKSQIQFSLNENEIEFQFEFSEVKSLISDSSDFENVDCFSLSKFKFGFGFGTELDMKIEIVRVFLGNYDLNESLLNENCEPVILSLLISDDLQTIKCKIQGGFIFMETSTIAKFANNFHAYSYLLISSNGESSSNSGRIRVSESSSNGESSSSQSENPIGFYSINDFDLDLSQFSLTLALSNQSGKVQELVISANSNVQITNQRRKVSFDLPNLSISQNNWSYKLSKNNSQTTHSLVPQFRSEINLPISRVEEFNDESISLERNEGYILKQMSVSGQIEKNNSDQEINLDSVKLMSDWIGNVVLSGLDFSLSLSTIQMLSNLFAPLNEIKNGPRSNKSTHFIQSENQDEPDISDYKIPDGAIVTIMDIDQHMYLAIEAIETKYRVIGTLHYSLVGERALFKVKHHKRWRQVEQIISFTSLYNIQNNNNNNWIKPICLSYNSKSDFIETSSNSEKSYSLWKAIPVPTHNFEDYDENTPHDSKPSNLVPANSFYLVNYKNNLGIGFVDGLPEFAKKPGNPFRVRVLNEGERCAANENVPGVQVKAERICLNILHDVSGVRDEVPLVRGCINDVNVTAHFSSEKIRVLASFDILGQYYDARKDEWKDIICPVPSFCFFRYRLSCQKPIHCFFGMKQMNIYVNELSVDILLYLVGILDIMGPYAVRKSAIFPNSCKIENQSGVSVLCHFQNKQDVLLPPKQSSSLFLRHVRVGNESQARENSVSISLVKQGAFSTSPINVPLNDSCVFAWRTRITSLNDSRSFPGPFIVAEVSKQSEEGLTISVSPMLRIHNKTEMPIELRFSRRNESKEESAFVTLRNGDTIDESVGLFDAIDLSGGSKRALLSLAIGNFVLSFRPVISKDLEMENLESVSSEWSEDITGKKPIRISGVFEKLNYKLKRVFGAYSFKSLFSSLSCPFLINNQQVSNLHFLIQIVSRDVPLQKPSDGSSTSENHSSSPVALQMQRDIFISPTVLVYNFLQSEIRVILAENHTDIGMKSESNNFGRDSIISSGSSSYFYANPSSIFISVTIISNGSNSKCKTLNSTEWVKKLQKQKTETPFLDIELEFDSEKYFALLRLLRGEKGLLEVAVFTKYTLYNNTELPLLCTTSYLKSLSRFESGNEISNISREHGCHLSPASSASWFAKSTEVHMRSIETKTSVANFDMEALSAFTEIRLEMENNIDGTDQLAVLGVSLKPLYDKPLLVPAQVVHIVPRYLVSNDSSEDVFVRQCYVEDNTEGTIIKSKDKITLLTTKPKRKSRETFFDSLLRGHKSGAEESQIFVQFRVNGSENGYRWSGPVCAASLGRFFVKFRKNLDENNSSNTRFGLVRVLEENNSLVLRFDSNFESRLPYRVENELPGLSIMYSQKGSIETDILRSGEKADYIWDDINLPHKLVVRIVDMNLVREISIDKICPWRPLFKMQQNRTLGLDLSILEKGLFRSEKEKGKIGELLKQRPLDLGYEVYFDGLTRVLRISQRGIFAKIENFRDSFANVQFRLSSLSLHFRESNNQIVDEVPIESTIIILNLAYISLDSVITNQQKHISARIQSINGEERWNGAKFGSILRRSQRDYVSNGNILSVIFVLSSKKSTIKLVDYFSLLLQPIDLKIDEDTLMKLVPFLRSSLSDPNTPSQKYYFKRFEIHPIKISASFRPGISNTTYTSTQEALRSLLHTVVNVPEINNSVVELNGVLLNHALVTSRELALKCAQHYSWYILRGIYIAKGSKLLPPTFASIFDDSALSSLDVFFDPSDGSISLPGVTIGMFKFISKGIKSKGLSGTKRYFGDLGITIKRAGSKALFAVMTEVSDSILRGAETNGFNGMMNGFHQGIMRLAMEPSVLGLAIMDGGPDRKIKLDRIPGLDELYIEGYLQGMLDVTYKLEYLRVRVIDDQVILKNLPPSSTVINEIMENVKYFLISKALLKGDASSSSRPLRHLHSESQWRLGPTILTLCEHLFVGFAIRMLQKQAVRVTANINWKGKNSDEGEKQITKWNSNNNKRIWAVGRFVLSGMIAYVDGRLCRHIPNPIARRIVSGFLLSFLDRKET